MSHSGNGSATNLKVKTVVLHHFRNGVEYNQNVSCYELGPVTFLCIWPETDLLASFLWIKVYLEEQACLLWWKNLKYYLSSLLSWAVTDSHTSNTLFEFVLSLLVFHKIIVTIRCPTSYLNLCFHNYIKQTLTHFGTTLILVKLNLSLKWLIKFKSNLNLIDNVGRLKPNYWAF